MKRKLQILTGIIVLTFGILALSNILSKETTSELEQKKLTHKEFLANSPFKNTDGLTKLERIEQGLPPTKYLERIWELTMNPKLGRPTPENLDQIRADLQEERLAQFGNRVPGDASGNDWIERGPDNVGGRSRAVMFDPNDPTNETVFAGGVSGGLWKNTNISNPSSVWTQVALPENLNISCIASDPNDSDIIYVGTGERVPASSTTVSGNGLWKSDDGGATWSKQFGGPAEESEFGTNAKVTVNSPAGIAGDYIAVDSNFDFGVPLTGPITGNLVLVNDGTANPNEGCNALVNGGAVNGNIAIIYRGSCNFTDKVKNAENAGATAVIMINNVGGPPIVMGGDTQTITIPAVMVTKADGQLMVDELGSGVNVTLDTDTSSGFVGIFTLAGNQYINDIVVRDIGGGASEVYIAAGAGVNPEGSAATWLGLNSYGILKSDNGGATWTEPTVPLTAGGTKYEPFDLEIGADNIIWMSSINNFIDGTGGGTIFSSSTDGNTFSLQHTLTNANRTQIASSATDANKIYVIASGTGTSPVIMEKTLDGFASTTPMSIPNDPTFPSDFTNGQSYYDLYIKVDPTNDSNLFAGGISIFNSPNEGGIWGKISYAYVSNGTSYVHADQHAIAFGNGDANKILFGNDGGVYYSANKGTTSSARNTGFNVTQFYSAGVAPTAAVSGASLSGDYFAGGTQDNGTQYFGSANSGVNSSVRSQGGDGAATMFDQDGTDTYYISNYVYNDNINKRDYATGAVTNINNESLSNGDFINQEALDSNLDLLYTNYSTDTAFQLRRYALSFPFSKAILDNALLDANPTALTVSPYTTGSTTLMVGTENGKLLKVTNAQIFHGWSDISGPDFFGSISDIEFGQNENEIFVTMFNYGVENIWYTNDGGTTWVAKEGDLPDLPVKAVLQNPLNTEQVIIGTDLGVWYTQDFSSVNPKWSSAFNGMSNVIVLDLDLRDDNTVFAATHGRGIFSGVFTADVLDVEDNILKDGINLYPSVSNGEITIKSNLNLGDVKLNVFNISGQKVYTSNLELSNNTQKVNLNLSSGMYLAQFTVDNISETKKIIIK